MRFVVLARRFHYNLRDSRIISNSYNYKGGVVDDRQFMTQFLSVIGLLTLIMILAIVIARIVTSGQEQDTSDPLTQKMIEERIKPVGQVYVGSVPAEASKPAASETKPSASQAGAAKFASGQEVYEAVCFACHATGAAGSPKFGDKQSWAKYLEKGIEGNYANAIKGTAGGMPPKGGRADLADEDVKAAVDYMVSKVTGS
jgi:cytochrome c5